MSNSPMESTTTPAPSPDSAPKKKRFRVPGTPALLLGVILFVGILTYIVPAGQFERQYDAELDRTLVVAGTYEYVEQSPVSPGKILASVFEGLRDATDLISFVFVVGGAFAIVQNSGAINAGLGSLIKRFKGQEYILIAILMIAFSIGGATFGMAEETLPFVAIMVLTSLAMGFDKVVGVSLVLIGVYCGYSAGPLNPFNVGVAQDICELPTFSGLGLRVVLMVGSLIIAIHHTIMYCRKLKKNKLTGSVDTLDAETEKHLLAQQSEFDLVMTPQRKAIMLVLCGTLVILVVGVMWREWFFSEISALFFAMAIVVGVIKDGPKFNKIADEFIAGAAGMATAAILMGLSRGILVVAEQGVIMDTIVYAISVPLSNLHSVFAAWGMYIAQGFINFFIPSSSGQAVVVMPIMSAISDLIGVSRQTAVMAFAAGDGYWNMITPTHSVVMASLGLAGISFEKWFKYAFPLVIKWSVLILALLAVAVLTEYGPF